MNDLSALRLGWIPYWNLVPLRLELEKNYRQLLYFNTGHPSAVNRMLAAGDISLAPCSSVCLLKNASHEMAFPLGVACNGSVQSVYLGVPDELAYVVDFMKERMVSLREIFRYAQYRFSDNARQTSQYIWNAIEELPVYDMDMAPRIRFSPHSMSSVALSKVLYRLVFGKAAFDANVSNLMFADQVRQPYLELLIGDEALVKRPGYSKVIDLGSMWRNVANLPFVFAVWQSNGKPVKLSWRKRILAAAEIAEAKMQVEPQTYYLDQLPLDCRGMEINLASYWRGIHYRLSARDIRGLLLFLCLAKPLLKADLNDSMIVKMLRWQQMSYDSA